MRYRTLILAGSVLLFVGCGEEGPGVDLTSYPHLFDLAAHTADAQPRVESRRIDFGTRGARLFQVRGWTADDVFADDGSTFTWSLGKGSTLQLYLLEPRDLDVEARLRPYRIDGPPQRVEIALNGRTVEVLELKGGMRLYRFELPEEALVWGRNVLDLHNVYPEKIGPGPPDLGPPGTAWDYLTIEDGEPVAVPEGHDSEIRLPFGTELSFLVELGAPSLLAFDAIESSHRGGRLAVAVHAESVKERLLDRRLGATAKTTALALDVGEPTLVRLTLAAIGRAGGELRLRRPRLVSAAQVTTHVQRSSPPVAPAEETSAPVVPGHRPNVLVYLVDTLRADHLGCYGYRRRATSPEIDAFAADAVLFENALAQSSWTRSAVASLLTGRVPPSHGVKERGDALSPKAKTLAELLRDAGYATAAFVTNGNASDRYGFDQGFDVFELLGEDDSKRTLHALSDAVNRAAFSWLEKPRKGPFFLYLHTMEPHAPYAPRGKEPGPPVLGDREAKSMRALRRRFESRFGASADIVPGSMSWMQGLHRGILSVEPARVEKLVELYDAEIAFNDHYFGRLLQQLKERGPYDDTVVAFVADHGEEFYDHGGWEHGRTLYQEQLRIPFIVRFPDGPFGVRVAGPAQQIDLLPTLSAYLGLPPGDGVQGESLRTRLGAKVKDDGTKAVYSHLELDGAMAESLIEGRFKILCRSSGVFGCELFDLEEDPGEEEDLASQRPVLVGYMEQRLRSFRDSDAALEAVEAEVDTKVLEQLRALGYL